jgi:hypothetical protein
MKHYTETVKARIAELGTSQRLIAFHTGLGAPTVNTVINKPETANMGSILKVLTHLGLTLYIFPEKVAP